MVMVLSKTRSITYLLITWPLFTLLEHHLKEEDSIIKGRVTIKKWHNQFLKWVNKLLKKEIIKKKIKDRVEYKKESKKNLRK